jgi:intein/homing endonuclease
MNELYFDKIDTQDKAYWLGFLYADGYHSENWYKIGMALSVRDVDHIKLFCDFLKIEKEKIKTKLPFKINIQGRTVHSDGTSSIQISNKHMSHSLSSLGLVSKKSLILKFPTENQVPLYLINHFVRGYFDGDGCLSKTKQNNVTRYGITILSSKDFCQSLLEMVNKELKINMCMWNNKGKIDVVHISGNRQVKKFTDWMYKDSIIQLKRKYEIYEELNDKMKIIDARLKNKYSSYKNISFDKYRNKWISMVRINKKTKCVGRFNTELEALNAQKLAYKNYKQVN